MLNISLNWFSNIKKSDFILDIYSIFFVFNLPGEIMKLDDDFDEDYEYKSDYNSNKRSNKLINTCLIISISFALVIGLVFYINSKSENSINHNKNVSVNNTETEIAKSVDELISGSTLTADQLDFWHDYDEPPVVSSSINQISDNDSSNPMEDGKHTKITYENGTEEWIDINPYLALNNYNYSNLVLKNNILKYYDNHENVSFAGVDLSQIEDYVDFNRLKNAGIDYVMLKIGQRGYSSGQINIDENFVDNATRAYNAGLDIGVYFFSEAITPTEAVEEADFVIRTLSDNALTGKITYPVVFYSDDINKNQSRAYGLNQLLRTNIAIAFMDEVRKFGYKPMISGNKEFMLKKLSFGSLIGYDKWLFDDANVPDFPYEFNMWRYSSTTKINGIAGYANMNISFTDYRSK